MNYLVYKSDLGNPITDSLLVAQKFERNHKDLLRSLRDTMQSAQKYADRRMFYETEYIDDRNRKQPVIQMTKDGFVLAVMGFTGDKAMKFKMEYITAFNEMEQLIKNGVPMLPNFRDPVAAARAWADSEEKRMIAEKKIEEDKPKVLFADAVTVSDDAVLIKELANILKQNGLDIGQNRLFEILRRDGYLCKGTHKDAYNNQKYDKRYNTPTQKAMNLGIFKIKKRAIEEPDGTIITKTTTLVTGKGQIYFINKYCPNQQQTLL